MMMMINILKEMFNAESKWPQGAHPQLVHLQHHPYTEAQKHGGKGGRKI